MSEFLYRQSVMAEDVDQLKLLEDKFMAIEKRLAPDESLPDAKGEIPGMQHSSETKPFLYWLVCNRPGLIGCADYESQTL